MYIFLIILTAGVDINFQAKLSHRTSEAVGSSVFVLGFRYTESFDHRGRSFKKNVAQTNKIRVLLQNVAHFCDGDGVKTITAAR